MKLTVLGGSAAGPNPGQGCSGYLLQSGPSRIVLDLGPGTLPELRKHADFRTLEAIVISHMHVDHILDLFALRFALSYNPVRPARPTPLWLPPGGKTRLERIGAAFAESDQDRGYFTSFTISEYDPSAPLTLDRFTIAFFPTVHYVPTWAMRVADGHGDDLFYTADTGPAADLARVAAGAGVVIAEGTATTGSDEPHASRGHLTPSEAGAIARDARAGALVLSHLWYENDPALALMDAEAAFNGPVILATPGVQLEWL